MTFRCLSLRPCFSLTLGVELESRELESRELESRELAHLHLTTLQNPSGGLVCLGVRRARGSCSRSRRLNKPRSFSKHRAMISPLALHTDRTHIFPHFHMLKHKREVNPFLCKVEDVIFAVILCVSGEEDHHQLFPGVWNLFLNFQVIAVNLRYSIQEKK